MKFSDRSKANPFTLEDGNGITIYFNDGISETFGDLTKQQLELIEELKLEETLS